MFHIPPPPTAYQEQDAVLETDKNANLKAAKLSIFVREAVKASAS